MKDFINYQTEAGMLLGAKYAYNNVSYIQTELTAGQLQSLLELFIDLDLPIKDINDLQSFPLGKIVDTIIRNKAIPKVLSILLCREDKAPIEEAEFTRGKALSLIDLVKEVVADFFSLNSELGERIEDYFTQLLEALGAKASEYAVRLQTEFSSPAKATSPRKKKS